MSFIKSALEIAMEKTEGIKGDKTALAAAAGKEEGKKLASAFFADPTMDAAKKFKEFPADRLPWIKEGFFGVVLANLTMPRDEADIARLEPIGAALEAVIRDKSQVKEIKKQLGQFFKKCIEDRKHLADALVKQLAPMIRQKEAQLAKQMGRPIKIDPKADPDFAKAYNQNMGNLESRYSEVLAQVKAELSEMFEKSK
jgi:phage-related tail protein